MNDYPRSNAYSPKVTIALIAIPHPMTQAEFLELAMACLDQAGASTKFQDEVRTRMVRAGKGTP